MEGESSNVGAMNVSFDLGNLLVLQYNNLVVRPFISPCYVFALLQCH